MYIYYGGVLPKIVLILLQNPDFSVESGIRRNTYTKVERLSYCIPILLNQVLNSIFSTLTNAAKARVLGVNNDAV